MTNNFARILLKTSDDILLEVGKIVFDKANVIEQMQDQAIHIVSNVYDSDHQYFSGVLISKSLVNNTWLYMYEVYRGINLDEDSQYYYFSLDDVEFSDIMYVGERIYAEDFQRSEAFKMFAEICATY